VGRRGLVVFDCDGVLTNVKNSWGVLHGYFGSRDNKVFADYYKRGLITYEDWMKIDVALMIHSFGKPIRRVDVERALSQIKVRDEAYEVVAYLKEQYVVAVVSAGVEEIVGRVCRELGVDLCFYNELKYVDGELVPGGVARVPLMEKNKVIHQLAERLGFEAGDVTYIGDDVWDIPVFEGVGNSIAVKPCGDACARARWVVEDLRETMPLIDRFYMEKRVREIFGDVFNRGDPVK
jgi:phosphoserine phosphatase